MNATATTRAGFALTEGGGNVFSNSVTTDPSRVQAAWDRLSENTWALEIELLPLILHQALVATERTRLSESDVREAINRHLVRNAAQCREMSACRE